MELDAYVDTIREHFLAAAAAGGEETEAVAQRLLLPLDAAIRLALHEALAAAAEEITCELAPGSVELRLRQGGPEFVVALPHAEEDEPEPDEPVGGGEDGAVARINLRLPEQLKAQVESAAAHEGVSVNTWLVRTSAAALQRVASSAGRARGRPRDGTQRYSGWSR
jgi:HicB family